MSSTARPASSATPRKAAVLGSPVAHSKSPQLHLAAYRALGLDGWSYERIECGAEELPGVAEARTDIHRGRTKVTLDPETVSASQVVSAIESAGYGASLDKGE